MPDPGAPLLPPLSRDNIVRATITAGADVPINLPAQQASIEFTLLRVAGEGGMGIVYRALQHYPERIVALKLFKSAVAPPNAAKRFAREIGVLARLHHPGIAQLYCVGATNPSLTGQSAFMAMEFIDGLPLTTFASQHGLDIPARLRLLLKVCDALTYLHQQFIIHRDLKPTNILVDPQGNPKLIDFGLAWITDNDAPASLLTQAGELVGTLEYMSPEQAAADHHDIDAQTDVYSLGIILYELLAARRPFNLSAHSLVDAALSIAHSTPEPLSSNNRQLAGDLETIVHKAIAKDRAQRYRTIPALGEDLRRFLNHHPISARPPSLAYRARKFVRRHNVLLAAFAALLITLNLAWIVSVYQRHELRQASQRADAANRQADLRLAQADIAQGDALAVAENFGAARDSYNRAFDNLDHLGLSTFPAQLALWQLNLSAAQPLRIIDSHPDNLAAVALSPDARTLALGFSDGRLEVRDLASNGVIFSLPRSDLVTLLQQRGTSTPSPTVTGAQFSPDGKTLAVYCSNQWLLVDLVARRALRPEGEEAVSFGTFTDTGTFTSATPRGSLLALSLPMGRVDRLGSSAGPILALAPALNGLLLVDSQHELSRWMRNSDDPAPIGPVPFEEPQAVTFSPDASLLAVPDNRSLSLLSTSTLRQMFHLPLAAADHFVGFASPSTLLIANRQQGLVRVEDFAGQRLGTLSTPAEKPLAISDNLIVHLDVHHQLLLSTFLHSKQCRVLSQDNTAVTALALSADATRAALATARTIRIVDTTHNTLLQTLDINAPIDSLHLDDTGQTLTVTTTDHHRQTWNVDTARLDSFIPAPAPEPAPAATLLTAEHNELHFFDKTGHHLLRAVPFPARLAAIPPDARHALLLTPDNTLLFLDFTLPKNKAADVMGVLIGNAPSINTP